MRCFNEQDWKFALTTSCQRKQLHHIVQQTNLTLKHLLEHRHCSKRACMYQDIYNTFLSGTSRITEGHNHSYMSHNAALTSISVRISYTPNAPPCCSSVDKTCTEERNNLTFITFVYADILRGAEPECHGLMLHVCLASLTHSHVNTHTT